MVIDCSVGQLGPVFIWLSSVGMSAWQTACFVRVLFIALSAASLVGLGETRRTRPQLRVDSTLIVIVCQNTTGSARLK